MIAIPQPSVRRDGRCQDCVRLGFTFGLCRGFLRAAALFAGVAIAVAQTTSIPNAPGQGQPAQGQFAGSVASEPVPGVVRLSLQDAIDRGLKQNLGALLSTTDIRSARGQRWEQLSALLPHVTAAPYVAASEINLAELGLSSFGGVKIPPSVGPFSYFDARAT